MGFEHKSVLLNETIEGLNIKPDGIYVDGTLGGGGHAYEVCRRLGEKGSIIGIDQDEAAIEAAGIRLKDFGEKVTIIRSNYCDMKSKLQEQGIDKVDGIVSGRIFLSVRYGRSGIFLSRRCTSGYENGQTSEDDCQRHCQ